MIWTFWLFKLPESKPIAIHNIPDLGSLEIQYPYIYIDWECKQAHGQ